MSRAKPALITFDILKSHYADSKSDDEIHELLKRLQSTEEIIGLEPEFLALVEHGANLRPFHARKGQDMPDAIPSAVADNAITVLQNEIDNLTAIKGRIAEMAEGADGAPEEVGAGLPEEITTALSASGDNVLALVEEAPATDPPADDADDPDVPPKAGDGDDGDEPPPKADDGDDPDEVPPKAEDPPAADGGGSGGGLIGQLAQEKKDLLVSTLSKVMSGISDGTMAPDDARASLYAIIDALYEMTSDVGLLALSKAEALIDGTAAAEALAASNAQSARLDDVEKALGHVRTVLAKMAGIEDDN